MYLTFTVFYASTEKSLRPQIPFPLTIPTILVSSLTFTSNYCAEMRKYITFTKLPGIRNGKDSI